MIKDIEREIKRMLKESLRRSICCLSLGSTYFSRRLFRGIRESFILSGCRQIVKYADMIPGE